jgi:hypothetical protein
MGLAPVEDKSAEVQGRPPTAMQAVNLHRHCFELRWWKQREQSLHAARFLVWTAA